MKSSVILIFPKIDYEENYKHSWTPFSILSLAGVLETKNLNPILVDQNSEPNVDWFGRIEPHLDDALCVGFSIMTGGGQIGHAIELAAEIREAYPEVPLVWGGPHVSALPEQTAKHRLVDIAVVGQGDEALAEIALALQAGEPLRNIPGIYLSTNNTIHVTELRPFVRKDNLPMYPWHLVDPADYIRNDVTINSRTFGYVSSQGCPYRCKFCYEFGAYNAWWSGFEARRLFNDIKNLVNNYDINGIKFYDADFFVKHSRVKNFCSLLDTHDLKINWAGSANPNDILRMWKQDPSLLKLMQSTNCTRILMGMESGSNRMLELIDKMVTSERLYRVVDILTEYNFIGSFTFIVGFPGESVDDLNETIRLLDYIHSASEKHESRMHIFAPYPGTPLFATSLEYGFEAPSRLDDWSNYNYYQPQTPWVSADIIDIVTEYTRMH